MPRYPLRLSPPPLSEAAAHDELVDALAALPGEIGVERAFPAEVTAEAERAAATVVLPDADLTELDLVTLDPEASTDLDQAFAIHRDGAGWIVHYAIACLDAFVSPGGAVDAEARDRGQTLYAADGRIPLHPPVLSEGAASLLPEQLRPAYVWELALDGAGALTRTGLTRARVRSRRKLAYESAQADLDADRGPDAATLGLLREVGEARLAQEAQRGGASLSTPETVVTADADGYRLERRMLLPVETWNAQLSLLTGMAGARLMLDGGVGILRTMPPADEEAIARFRFRARHLGTPWPREQGYGEYLRGLDGRDPAQLAILHAAAALFRGAGYTAFDGEPPEQTEQAAIGAPYAHVTAPIRRLVDRFGLAICAAHAAGDEPPAWAREALPELPGAMARSSQRAGELERRTLDHVEAALLAPRVGQVFDAVVLAADDRGSVVQLDDPDAQAMIPARLTAGEDVRLRLTAADIAEGTVALEPAD
ncbi:MAG: RNB domain-containing ribonuclease [Actinomycetales bacterium]|nr:RNB domain-containing ribonuclease [Actinomycetales bacterium]